MKTSIPEYSFNNRLFLSVESSAYTRPSSLFPMLTQGPLYEPPIILTKRLLLHQRCPETEAKKCITLIRFTNWWACYNIDWSPSIWVVLESILSNEILLGHHQPVLLVPTREKKLLHLLYIPKNRPGVGVILRLSICFGAPKIIISWSQ